MVGGAAAHGLELQAWCSIHHPKVLYIQNTNLKIKVLRISEQLLKNTKPQARDLFEDGALWNCTSHEANPPDRIRKLKNKTKHFGSPKETHLTLVLRSGNSENFLLGVYIKKTL